MRNVSKSGTISGLSLVSIADARITYRELLPIAQLGEGGM